MLKNISQWEILSHILRKNKKCLKPPTRNRMNWCLQWLDCLWFPKSWYPKPSSSRHGWPWLRITHGILGLPKISPEFSDDLQSAIFFSKIRRLRLGRAYAHSSPRGRTIAPRRGPRRSAERRYGPSWNAPPTVWPPCAGASPRVWPGTVWAAGEVWERYGKGMIMMG